MASRHPFAIHRILISRFFALVFLLLVIFTESAQQESLVSDFLFLLGLLLVSLATAGRLWCAVYINGYKNKALVSEGPYSLTRNPLYFFSLIGFVGVGFATETFTIPLAALLLFGLLYPQVIKKEETKLRSLFGTAFDEYCARTPRFFPNLRLFREPESYSLDTRRFRRAIWDVLWFLWLVGLIEITEALRRHDIIQPLLRLP